MATHNEFDPGEDSIIDQEYPDRSTSASAPPALELATESLFAFTVQYANIFSDIRAHEDYYRYYEQHRQDKKLPPPLDPAPFLFETTEDDLEDAVRRRLRPLPEEKYNGHKYNSQKVDTVEPSHNLHKPLGNHSEEIPVPSKGIWAPLARKAMSVALDGYTDDLSSRLLNEGANELQQLTLNDVNFSSSPSAQTAFKSAQYIWNDEEQNDGGPIVQQVYPPSALRNESPVKERGDNSSQSKGSPEGGDRHSPQDEVSPRSNVICRYYAGGYCSRGEKCFYSHDSELQVQTKLEESIQGQQEKTNSKGEPKTKTPKKGARASTTTTPTKPTATNNGNAPASPRSDSQSSPSSDFYTSFDQLIGKVYLVSRDQQGCRFLQKKLEEEDPKTVEIIFNEVYDHITELMTDPFGNYLCQKLLEHCNDQQRLRIVESVSPDLVSISKNMHGTRAVQKMIECLSSPAQVQLIVKVLGGSVVELIQDLNGNHVIQRCLNRLTPKDNQFIYDAVTSGNNCVQVATHRHGCCVLQRCIDHGSEKQKVQLIQEITKNALTLVQDPYGNYVVQYVLELPFPDLVDSLAKGFVGHVRQLATQKFSSNVIEKCLSLSSPPTCAAMVREVLIGDNLLVMLSDPFANYVVQTALSVSDSQLHLELVDAIKPHLAQLRNTPYGKRIQSKISKETAERAGHKKESKNKH